jgi:CRP-like cAMP-binding protein
MALERDVQLLRALPLLSAFDTEALRILAFSADRRTFAAGSTVFRKGERSDGAHLVISGRIDLDAGDGSAAVPIAPGALIGETALFTETQRPATAVMAERGETLRIPRVLVRRVLGEYPETARAVHRLLAERLDATRQALAAIEAGLIGDAP